MCLPYRPEPENWLAARFARALTTIFDAEACALGVAPLPCQSPRNVFDFADGLRLVASLDRGGDGRVRLHLSSIVFQFSELGEAIRTRRVNGDMALMLSVERYYRLSRDRRRAQFMYQARGGALHWRIDGDAPLLAEGVGEVGVPGRVRIVS